ncbi:hypothetical protein FNV43_RR01096 [Rhamnella rubrinervis]|uniref:WAT1-related protein n=1 Tax=Rhamnella rubrinervis TaxID=2594499 RepID=A0A8K0HPS8_9ROSA|nr:hypothetical protein FNV43_RR01096 [Rhamnella rubrinervis]
METRKPKTRNGFQGGHELKGRGSSGPPEKRFAGDNRKLWLSFTLIWSSVILLPLILGVNLLLIKCGLEHGMKIPVYQVFKNSIGAAFGLPCIWIRRPVCSPFCYYGAMHNLSSKSFACLTSLVPILTFGGALLFRLETININQRRSQIKLVGIIVLTIGSIVVGFYDGLAVAVSSSSVTPPHLDANWKRGLLYVVLYLISQITYNILLAKTLEIVPEPLAIAGWTSLCAVLTNAFIALILESRTSYAWFIFGPGRRLFVYLYGGIFIAMLATYIQARVTQHKGIMVLQSFSPLYVVFMVVFSAAVLHQHLVPGRIVGAVLVICGLALILLERSELLRPQVPQVIADNVENVVEAATGNMPIV